jgi:hypothetical protein
VGYMVVFRGQGDNEILRYQVHLATFLPFGILAQLSNVLINSVVI